MQLILKHFDKDLFQLALSLSHMANWTQLEILVQ